MRTPRGVWTPVCVALTLLLAACGGREDAEFLPGEGPSGAGGSPSVGGAAGTAPGGGGGGGSMGGTGGTAGAGGCVSAEDCDDGISCTVDFCDGGVCSRVVGPNSGSTACPPGQICNVLLGCVDSPACETTADCQAALGSDPCNTNIACDLSADICLYDILDADSDGHPPISCGGNDCDDTDRERQPGLAEVCNGKDSDCSGVVDDGAPCAGLEQCLAGSCQCPAANQCGASCVDKLTDSNHCGSCSRVCQDGSTCQNGFCVCGGMDTYCADSCVDIMTDPLHCGLCDLPCGAGFQCITGACWCPLTECGNTCIDTRSDPDNCGGCGQVCPVNATCQGSDCHCPPGQTECSGECVDTETDPSHCGFCGNACGGCQGGVCTCPSPALVLLADQSGSMSTNMGTTATTRWLGLVDAINLFALDPASTNVSVALVYFPLPATGVPTTCTVEADCLGYGPCILGICLGSAGGGSSCDVADYSTPEVAMQPLPGIASAISASLAAHGPDSNTPTAPALEGALTYAQSWASTTGNANTAVVLITDGSPNTCTPDTPDGVALIADAYAQGTPSIPTYVIGIDADVPAAEWTVIAQAGTTGSVRLATSPSALRARLNAIRDSMVCP